MDTKQGYELHFYYMLSKWPAKRKSREKGILSPGTKEYLVFVKPWSVADFTFETGKRGHDLTFKFTFYLAKYEPLFKKEKGRILNPCFYW